MRSGVCGAGQEAQTAVSTSKAADGDLLLAWQVMLAFFFCVPLLYL